MPKHPLVQEWSKHPITELLYKLINSQKEEYTEVIINSDGFYSDAGIKHMLKLVGQIQLIDQLNNLDELFSEDDLIQLGDRT